MQNMKLIILQPDRTVFNGEVQSVALPGKGGKFELLTRHAPLISTLDPGEILYRREKNGAVETLTINGGFIKIKQNVITICID